MSTTNKKLLLSKPLLKQHWALVVKQDHISLQYETPIDLRHQRVITLRNNPAKAILQANYPGVDINETDSLHEALRLLNAGAAQGIFVMRHKPHYYPVIFTLVSYLFISSRQSLANKDSFFHQGKDNLRKRLIKQ